MSLDIQIEPVSAQTLPYACALFKELHDLGSLAHIPFDEEYTRGVTLRRVHDASWWGRLARNLDNTEYVGVMVGSVDAMLWTPRLVGLEHAIYVRPTKFRGAIAMNLVKSFLAWCYEVHDCLFVESSDVASINGAAYHALYTRAGYRYYGSLYNHEPGR